MKLELWCLGKNSLKYLDQGINDYQKRLNHYVPFQLQVFHIPSAKKSETPENIKKTEADIVLKQLKPTDTLVLFDEKGKHFSSVDFAEQMNQWFVQTPSRLVFLIGGAFGFDDSIYQRATLKVSFSKMTFNHLLFRLIALEQLYRAMTILKNEPYHH